jgi:hypothetical protein
VPLHQGAAGEQCLPCGTARSQVTATDIALLIVMFVTFVIFCVVIADIRHW